MFNDTFHLLIPNEHVLIFFLLPMCLTDIYIYNVIVLTL